MRILKPLILRDSYYDAVEREIQRIFDKLIYIPIFKILRERLSEFQNAGNALIDSIRLGLVWYDDGHFRGKFSAKISKELRSIGAKYDARSSSWKLASGDVPADVRIAQVTADSRYRKIYENVTRTLDVIDPSQVDSVSQTKENYEKTISSMETDFQKTVPKGRAPATARSRIAIEAQLTPEMKAQIAEDWGENLNLYIKGWMQENVLKLREQIQPHVLGGGRAQALVKSIQDNYGVSQRKAKFLARQETALLMSKFQETRYLDMGVTRYRWSDAHDRRVRHDHHDLNGKIFSFSNPPITNRKTGARNNPGQDYNCRCVAIPIIE